MNTTSDSSNIECCAYRDPDGIPCPHPTVGQDATEAPSRFCRWHCKNHAAENIHREDVAEELQSLWTNGQSLAGFQLKKLDLEEIHLAAGGECGPVDLRGAQLNRTILEGAHLYRANLSGASLLKARLANANLNFADLRNADLLGVDFTNANLEHVHWGERVLQDHQSTNCHDPVKRHELYVEAEEIYRNLRQQATQRGHMHNAGLFFHREMLMRHKQLPIGDWRWWIYKAVDIICGYGEKPGRLAASSVSFITFFAVIYSFLGVSDGGTELAFSTTATVMENLSVFGSCLYFSIVTFTTLGYGDIVPTLAARPAAGLEAFLGAFMMALFIVVFVRKLTR